MPSVRIPISDIQSWTPAIDAKSVENGSLFVLEGQNYLFDAKGPKSGFGSVLVDREPLDTTAEVIESINIAGRTIILTGTGAYERRAITNSVLEEDVYSLRDSEWFQLAAWEAQRTTDIGGYGWTSAYVGFGSFLNHPGYGLFRLFGDTLEPFQPLGIEGVIYSITESAGRLVLLTPTMIQYSNADDASDMTPQLGGAGFQITSQRVPGVPLALTSFQGGFIVWTSGGVLAAEFVGGEIVFRFDRVITEQFLLNQRAWSSLATGEILLMTKQGLYLSSASQGLRPYSELFNEFLRDMMADSDAYSFRLDYIKEDDLLYVQMSESGITYNRTFVYHQAAQKWGEFSEIHRGIIRFDSKAGNYGYADVDGFVHHFDGSAYRETVDGELTGLNSYMSLGFIRPASGAEYADVMFEMQEILLSARKSSVPHEPVEMEDWNGPDSFVSYNNGFYTRDENWSEFGVDYYDIDWNDPSAAENWSLPGEDADWNEPVAGQRDFDWSDSGYQDVDWSLTPPDGVDTSYIEDWGYLEVEIEEDWDGITATYNYTDYTLSVICDLDGFERDLIVVPVRAVERMESDLWTLFSHGHNQRLVVAATLPWEKFHVTSLAFSVSYAGQLS